MHKIISKVWPTFLYYLLLYSPKKEAKKHKTFINQPNLTSHTKRFKYHTSVPQFVPLQHILCVKKQGGLHKSEVKGEDTLFDVWSDKKLISIRSPLL